MNVGSVGEPRDSSPLAAYVVYDALKREVELRRVPYDSVLTEAKVRQAGLPLRRRLGTS